MKFVVGYLLVTALCIVVIPQKTKASHEPHPGSSLQVCVQKNKNTVKEDRRLNLEQKIYLETAGNLIPHWPMNFCSIRRNCETVDTFKPCKKPMTILKDLNIRQGFRKLWQASNTNLPLGKRSEQGGWIVLNENGYKVIPFPSQWQTSPCGINLPDDFLDYMPSNLVGIVHTHPFFEGEDTTAPDVCGEEGSESYQSGGNDYYLDLIIRIANHLSNFCIKGYIVDGDNIISMNTVRFTVRYPSKILFQLANS